MTAGLTLPAVTALVLVYHPNPTLLQKSREVDATEFGDALESYTDLLVNTMYKEHGVGLAAVQVGDLRRILVVLQHEMDHLDGKTIA